MVKRGVLLFVAIFSISILAVCNVEAACESKDVMSSAKPRSGRDLREEEMEGRNEKLEAIDRVRLDGAKIYPDRWKEDKLYALLTNIDALESDAAKKVPDMEAVENNVLFCFHFKDGSKKIYSFFKGDDGWYMQADNVDIYSGAEFIEGYVDYMDYGDGYVDTKVIPPDTYIIELSKDFSAFDTNFYYSAGVLSRIEDGLSEAEAMDSMKEKITNDYLLYQYAMNHGYACTNDEAATRKEKELKAIQEAVNFSEYEAAFKEFDTTYQDFLDKTEKSAPAWYTIENLMRGKYEEFKCGNDEINGIVFDTQEEYWNEFLSKEVQSETSTYDTSEVEELLNKAEIFYKEYKN